METPLTNSARLSTAQVAHQAGVHKDTLLRWLRRGLVPEPHRDRRGWRLFTQEEAHRIISATRMEIGSMPPGEPAKYSAMPEIDNLKVINWDFKDAKTIYLTHGLHPYPAKFIPQIPNTLIQELSSVGETIADIFCGSGTTLVESLLLKRNTVGVDANPLACLISKAKTTRLEPGDAEQIEALVKRSEELAASLASQGNDSLFGPDAFHSQGWRPNSPALAFWFEPFAVEELAEILSWCRALHGDRCQGLALTALSSIVVAVSRQDSDTRYVRRQKDVKPGDVARRFARSLSDAARTAQEFAELSEARFQCQVHCHNILDRPPIGRVHLVVCSPPYPNAYSYHLYHMTRMLWLEMDQPKFKQEEIGSHRKYSKKRNGATEHTFRDEMSTILSWLTDILEVGRYACFVVGNSCIGGRDIDNAQIIAEAAGKCGFKEVARIPRRMQDSKKSFNPAIGKIKVEQIVILKNLNGNRASD